MFYDATYHEDGTLASFAPNNEHAPSVIKKQMVLDVTEAPYPQAPVVPLIKATQDRVVLEISERMYPRMPFLSGRHAVSSDQRAQCGTLEAIRQSNAGKAPDTKRFL